MMRIALLSVVFLAALVAGGCARSQFDTDTPSNFVQADGLKVEMQLPGRYFKTGDDLRVAVTATNMTGKPISIHSPTGACRGEGLPTHHAHAGAGPGLSRIGHVEHPLVGPAGQGEPYVRPDRAYRAGLAHRGSPACFG